LGKTTIENILRLASILVSCIGVYVWFRPDPAAEKIEQFYSRYLIVRYAGDKEMTRRFTFLRLIGIVLFIVGLICPFSIYAEF
jgi:uncharacterized protein YjeT (DUF2065 family)